MSEPEAEPSAPHPLDGVPYLDGLGLTGPERQEWESRKRGTHVAIVLALASGRFVVADVLSQAKYVVAAEWLGMAVQAIRDSAVDEYKPPASRSEARVVANATAEDLGL